MEGGSWVGLEEEEMRGRGRRDRHQGAEMEATTMEGEGRVAEVSMKGEGGVEDLIDGNRGGEGWDWRRKKSWRMVGLEEEKRVRRMGRRVVGEEGTEVERATMEWEGSWTGLEDEDKEKKGKGRGRMDCRREGAVVEGAAVKGEGWAWRRRRRSGEEEGEEGGGVAGEEWVEMEEAAMEGEGKEKGEG